MFSTEAIPKCLTAAQMWLQTSALFSCDYANYANSTLNDDATRRR